ncbi:MAG: pyridoxamine 5'-phosphate oxidase family protein, partial [Planctomycetota bacterium]
MSDTEMVDHGQMAREAWRRLSRAASDPTHPMRLFTVASLARDGEPDARILVLRGASRDLRCLWFHTDRRSAKVRQLLGDGRICGVSYDPRDGVQLRVRGNARIRSDDEVAERHWQQTEMAARFAYAVNPGPGEPLVHPDPRMREHRASLTAVADHDAGRDNFAVIEMAIGSIEWLQIGELGDRRAIMHEQDGFLPR